MSNDEDRYYGIVARELAICRHREDLWTRAFAQSNGEANATTAHYIRLRVEQLRRSHKKAKTLPASSAARSMPQAGPDKDVGESAGGNRAQQQPEKQPIKPDAAAGTVSAMSVAEVGRDSSPGPWIPLPTRHLRYLLWGLVLALPVIFVAMFFGPNASRFSGQRVPVVGTRATVSSNDDRPDAPFTPSRQVTPVEVTSTVSQSRAAREIGASIDRRGDKYVAQVNVNDAGTLPFIIDSRASETLIPTDVLDLLARGPNGSSMYIGKSTKRLANGLQVEYPRILLRSLTVSGVRVENVIATVTPGDGVLLLGISFLGRLENFSVNTSALTLTLGTPNPLLGPWDSNAAEAAERTRYREVVDQLAKANVGDDSKHTTAAAGASSQLLGDELFKSGARLIRKRESGRVDHANDVFKLVAAFDRSRGHGVDIMCTPSQEPASLNQAQSELFSKAQAGTCIGHRFLLLALDEKRDSFRAIYYLAGEYFFAHALRSLAALNIEKATKDVGEKLAASYNNFVMAHKDDAHGFSPEMKALIARKEVERYDRKLNHVVWSIRAGLMMYQP